MKNLIFLFLLVSSSLFAQKTDDGSKHKVVFQFVSGDSLSQKSLINNLKNFREGWPKAQVEVVFHGNGIFMVTSEKTTYMKELMDFAQNKDVKMVVCGNTMKQKKITKEQLLPFVSVVPMGIGEIIIKQEEGWSYIKAGL
ncbi:MAG: DsrE family protein [Cytophagaceae bacterium]|nr:DsrE family protein [Cytophagaceae bacterium]MBK9509296.1 DsrE family protein [Cytophagaceae bacterium]MBK9933707.1 DsrE family protein [Cytophagaceae bacterium]MBL0302579.1 DsrE family protein [Cytophagaceae bacterium]MBL0325405.1 DsrE family protein [Cytophagaceae bacterium]